MLVCMILDS